MPRRRLVTQHLEDISWSVLEAYPEMIRELIKGRAGVYALYRRKNLYYVGLASNLMGRLKSHLRDRHNGKWDRFGVYLTVSNEHMKELESLMLRIASPPGNRTGGKFARSENLRNSLNRKMSDADADRRAILLGGSVARRRQRVKTRKPGKSVTKLKLVMERRIPLRGWHREYEYSGSLRRDGRIGHGGKTYDSPTEAAKAATGLKRCNGWRFWHYKNDRKEWVPLRQLRR